MTKKKPGYRRGVAIGRACLAFCVALAALKLTGTAVSLRLGTKALYYDFTGLSWWSVASPVWVPAGLIAAGTVILICIYFTFKK